MKALSIKQPWAWLICAGYKDIENRNWKIGRKSQHGPYSSYHQANFTVGLPCRIYVHAGKSVDNQGAIWLWEHKERLGIQGCMPQWTELCNTWKGSAIIGEVDIVDCVTESQSQWFVGKYGFVLANPLLYEKPIPCRGMLGFFEPLL
uniref:Putative ASCH domain-containing protein n=1 Tax=viral metagenome TaxID=1070528 RepID=A0A6M3KMY5_9ZZZZ